MDNPETEALLPPKDKRPGSPLSNQSTDSDSDSSLKQSEPSLLSKLDLIDKNLSEPIYNLEPNCLCEFLIYTCARLFNPDLMLSYFILVFAYHAIVYKDYFFIIKPLLHVITMLIITLITKHLIGRPRPQPRDSVKRRFNCRSKETNCSMPSGDSMQCANFAVIIIYYFNNFYGLMLIPFVMFSRVFYFCHYVFDTVVGTLIGLGASCAMYYILSLF